MSEWMIIITTISLFLAGVGLGMAARHAANLEKCRIQRRKAE